MSSPSLSAPYDLLLAAVSPSLRALALRGSIRTFRKNCVILHEGDDGDSLFILLQGSVKVYSTDEQGREIIYGNIREGDYFGEMSLDGGPRSASVMTQEACVCSVVTRNTLRDHLTQEPEFALELVTQVIGRARRTTETARRMALMDVYGRVVALLEGERGIATPEAPITLTQLTHQNIASRVGASREMVSRLLKDLEKGGYVELGVKKITLNKKLPSRW